MKQLTGKARVDFFEWLGSENKFKTLQTTPPEGDRYDRRLVINKQLFNKSPQSAKFGLIQEFADSTGYEIEAHTEWCDIYELGGWKPIFNKGCESRPESQEKAVEKLSEIYNSK